MPRSPSPERNHLARRRGGGGGGGGGAHVITRCRSPSPPARRSLRPRRAAAASSRPLVDDFFPFPSSPSLSPPRPQHRRPPSPEPSSSDSDGGGAGSSASDRRRRKLKLVVKLSQLPPDQQHRRVPPTPSYSDLSDGEEQPGDDGSVREEQVKPPKKRRIESRGDRSRHREAAERNDAASAPRTKRLPVPGMARTTPLPDRKALDMILDKLQKKDTYGVFAEPVNLDELPDYHDVIEHPMDFGTVKRKLARNAYRSFEEFEDDVFLICSNAMLYNSPDTIYFRQAHSIQELARKKFQELRNEGIPTVNQMNIEQKVRLNSCNQESIKKPVLRYSEDDLDFLIRKEKIKRPDSKNPVDARGFKDQIRKPIARNSEDDLSSSFHKERVKKPIRNSEDDLSSSFHKERVKKPIRNSEDDLSSSFHKERVKKPVRTSENDLNSSFHKERVKKPVRTSENDLNSSFHKERVKKPIRNSENELSSAFHKEQVKKPISRNADDDRSSSFHQVQVKKSISRGSENDRTSSFNKQQEKKTTSRSSKDDLPPQRKHILKPVSTHGQDSDRSSYKQPVENPICMNEDVADISKKKLAAKLSCRYRDDVGHFHQKESATQQDDLGYSCNEETVKKPAFINSQDALGSDVSAATIASAGDGSNGLSMSEANAAEAPDCAAANGFSDKDISSPVDEDRSEKTDDISARDYSSKPSHKPFVVDETRRKTYDASLEEQSASDFHPIFDVFSAEPKELTSVGLHADYSYARSLARFAGSLGAQGWRIASERIQKALPADVSFGRGWVGEYEPPLPPVLAMQDQSRILINSEANIRRNASLPRDNERLTSTESISAKDKSLSLLNRITAVNNVVGVSGSLESPEYKPRLFGVTAEPQQKSTDASSLHRNHRVSGGVTKTKRTTSEHTRKGRSSSSARPPEMQPMRPECSNGASYGVLDMPAVNKRAGQPRPFFQPPETVRTQQMRKGDSSNSTNPVEMAPQRLECLNAASGVHDMHTTNNINRQPKPFFQPQEAAVPQPKNEATWVYHGRPGDGKLGTSDKSRPMSSSGFITKNQPVNASSFAMNASGQKSINDHAKSMGSTAIPGQVNVPNRGFDVSRNIFSAFPGAVRENQIIPSAPMAQSWISFGASSESKPATVNPTFHDSNSGWKMPFANVHPSDEPKISAVPQFFRQPVQAVRESPVQNNGLVIFPQLVQTEFSRSQGQPQWPGLVQHMQQKPNKDVLRPDLNIGFPSPGSPPGRQSSGINLEAQQPDLALQL